MTSVVLGGLFNAVAFAVTGFLFSKLNHRGYEKEIKRHNKAMKSLAKEKWYEKKYIYMRRRQELEDAKEDLDEGNKALDEYRRAHKELLDHEDQKPSIQDFYKPSDEMKGYQDVVMGALGIRSGWLVSRVF